LPTLPLDCDDTLLALARGFCDHEAAHIRHTDFEALRIAKLTPTQTHLWNSLEDWRVEELLASIFPGCHRHFQRLIQQFFGEKDGGGTNPALSVLDWVLLTVRSWAFPALEQQRDREAAVIDRTFPGLRAMLETVLVSIRQRCRSTKETIAYALELAAIIEKYAKHQQAPEENKPSKAKKPDSQKTEAQTEEQADGHSEAQAAGHEDAHADAQADGQDDSTDCASEPEKEGSTDSQAQSLRSESTRQLMDLLQAAADDLPQHLGELMAQSLNSQQAKNAQRGLSVARVGSKTTSALPDALREAALKSCVALRTRLQALLQAKAQQFYNTGRRGKLNTQRLYALAVNNPRVFIKSGEKSLTSTAVHLLLDCSGSMCGPKMELASLACYAVAKALEGCKGVNVGVTVFPAHGFHTDGESVAQIVRHGERVHHNFALYPACNTPLAESLWWVMQQMYPLREARKIILMLSDGAPDSLPATEHVLNKAKTLGFEMLGLGIQDNSMAHLLPKGSRIIDDLQSLAPAMFDMLQKAFWKEKSSGLRVYASVQQSEGVPPMNWLPWIPVVIAVLHTIKEIMDDD
jgi:hypothetical protein